MRGSVAAASEGTPGVRGDGAWVGEGTGGECSAQAGGSAAARNACTALGRWGSVLQCRPVLPRPPILLLPSLSMSPLPYLQPVLPRHCPLLPLLLPPSIRLLRKQTFPLNDKPRTCSPASGSAPRIHWEWSRMRTASSSLSDTRYRTAAHTPVNPGRSERRERGE